MPCAFCLSSFLSSCFLLLLGLHELHRLFALGVASGVSFFFVLVLSALPSGSLSVPTHSSLSELSSSNGRAAAFFSPLTSSPSLAGCLPLHKHQPPFFRGFAFGF